MQQQTNIKEIKPSMSLIVGGKERIQKAKGQLLRASQVAALLGMSVPSVWRIAKNNKAFPQPFKVSMRVTVWDETEVLAFIQNSKGVQA